MTPYGYKQRLCFSGWVIGALILAMVNLFGFFSMEGQPLQGYSPVIKSLQSKLTRFENAPLITTAFSYGENELRQFFGSYHLKEAPSPVVAGRDVVNDKPSADAADNQPTLPVLEGIMQIMDRYGVFHYRALISGKVCGPKDQVMNFVVEKISPQGVLVSDSGKNWFIKRPEVYYSSDRGE